MSGFLRGVSVLLLCGAVSAAPAFAQEVIYSNLTGKQSNVSSGFYGITNGVQTNFWTEALNAGAGGGYLTAYIADDLRFDDRFRGALIKSYSFTVANTNSTAVTFQPIIRMWDDNGAKVGVSTTPGNLFYKADLDYITLQAGEERVITITDPQPDLTYGALSLPSMVGSGSASRIWAGLAFYSDGSAGHAGATELDNLGSVLYSANPDVGFSDGASSVTIDNTTQNYRDFYNQKFINATDIDPEGYLWPLPNAPYAANYGWQFVGFTVPEPGTFALAGMVIPLAVGFRVRRRKQGQHRAD